MKCCYFCYTVVIRTPLHTTLRIKHIVILLFRSEMEKRKFFNILCYLVTNAFQFPSGNES